MNPTQKQFPISSRFRTRAVFAVLLSLFISMLAGFAAPEKWAADIERFTTADTTNPPPTGAVVFVGHSSIKMWTSLATDFPGIPTINRGFGGSQLFDTVFYADRIVIPYQPRMVVVYAGENDLQDGKTPAEVAGYFTTFRKKVHAALPKTKIIYLSNKVSPIRETLGPKILELNALIAQDCSTNSRCQMLDVNTPLLDAQGKVRPELFRADRLHLQPAAYAIWARVLAPYLEP